MAASITHWFFSFTVPWHAVASDLNVLLHSQLHCASLSVGYVVWQSSARRVIVDIEHRAIRTSHEILAINRSDIEFLIHMMLYLQLESLPPPCGTVKLKIVKIFAWPNHHLDHDLPPQVNRRYWTTLNPSNGRHSQTFDGRISKKLLNILLLRPAKKW